MFKVKCEFKKSILTFYSKSKGIMHRLKQGKSVAVTDEVFFKAYLSMGIITPELQSEIRKFLKDPTVSYFIQYSS